MNIVIGAVLEGEGVGVRVGVDGVWVDEDDAWE